MIQCNVQCNIKQSYSIQGHDAFWFESICLTRMGQTCFTVVCPGVPKNILGSNYCPILEQIVSMPIFRFYHKHCQLCAMSHAISHLLFEDIWYIYFALKNLSVNHAPSLRSRVHTKTWLWFSRTKFLPFPHFSRHFVHLYVNKNNTKLSFKWWNFL